MKPLQKTIAKLAALLALSLLCSAAFAGVALASTACAVEYVEIECDSISEINDAASEARDNATAKHPYKIIVEPGTYKTSSCIYLCSNTYLYAVGCTFKQTSRNVMVRTGPNKYAISTSKAKGYCYKNITIEGGVWDKGACSSTGFQLCHGKNITVKNLTIKNVKNGHCIETAGVNGLTITNCKFKKQILTSSTKTTYEAIQLDILQEDHLGGYYSQDLPLKNVTVTNCSFQNVPRGVGTHTAVLNNPLTNLTITGCTFKNVKSCAIQLMGVKKVTIKNNTITKAARGIFVYSYRTTGTFLGTKLNSSSTSSKKCKPINMKLVISNNSITLSGKKDAYDKWDAAGILVGGLYLSSATDGAKGKGGTMKKGNYYIKNVKVTNNTVNSKNGHGIRLNDVRNATVQGNKTSYAGGSKSKQSWGISICERSQSVKVKGNTVKGYYRGIYLYYYTKSTKVTGNTVTGSYGSKITADSTSKGTFSGNK